MQYKKLLVGGLKPVPKDRMSQSKSAYRLRSKRRWKRHEEEDKRQRLFDAEKNTSRTNIWFFAVIEVIIKWWTSWDKEKR